MKILFLQKRPLLPADSGGKIRTLNLLKYVARWHDVTYLCNVQQGEEPGVETMRALGLRVEWVPWRETKRSSPGFYRDLAVNLLSPYPFNVAKDYDRRLLRRAQSLLQEEPYDLVICDFVQMARNALPLSGVPKLLLQHNVEAEIFRRQAVVGSLPRRAYMNLQWRKMRRFEAQAGWHFQTVVAVSGRDRLTFAREYGWPRVKEIDTAVDLEYFAPRTGQERPDRLVFVGSMDWSPNEEGIEHFVRRIWPAIRSERPTATIGIVGRNPSPRVRRLAEVDGVEVTGTVPDVRPYLGESAVVVVPLLVGGGTRIKIYEAMAMRKAVVSTPLGAEGLPVRDGEHLLLAETPEQFARAVLRLLRDEPLRRRLAASAQTFVADRYSAETIARQFMAHCRETIERHRSSPDGRAVKPVRQASGPLPVER